MYILTIQKPLQSTCLISTSWRTSSKLWDLSKFRHISKVSQDLEEDWSLFGLIWFPLLLLADWAGGTTTTGWEGLYITTSSWLLTTWVSLKSDTSLTWSDPSSLFSTASTAHMSTSSCATSGLIQPRLCRPDISVTQRSSWSIWELTKNTNLWRKGLLSTISPIPN
jgi:hypothetical protein